MSPKPLVILQHESDDPPGSIAAALRDLGVPFEVRRLDAVSYTHLTLPTTERV